MEVSPYSNTPIPVNSGNIGGMGNASASGNWSPEIKPAYAQKSKPQYKPMTMPAETYSAACAADSGKGKGAGPAAYAPQKGGAGKTAAVGKSFENSIHCPPQQGGTVYDPQTVNVQHIYKPVIVKHIHQLHTIRKTHFIYEHQHYYPHTLSETCDERHYDVQCGRPCFPKPHC